MSSAYIAIANILATYAERIDAADFDGVGELLKHTSMSLEGADGLETYTGAVEIANAFRGWARPHADGTLRTKHLITNIIADIDDDAGTATARSSALVLQQIDEVFPLQPIMTGGYRDRFECVDGEWRLVERFLYVDLVGDISQHLYAAEAGEPTPGVAAS
jgi:hypothetical protein